MPYRRMQDILHTLAAKGVQHFTAADLARILGVDQAYARKIAYRMAKANLARRVKQGLYALLPPTDWMDGEGFAVDWYLTAASLAEPDDYFLAYYTAMELHGMTQHPIRTVFIAVKRRHRNVQTGPVKFRFVTVRPARFFGAEDRQVEPGRVVRLATLERTFLDCADRPDLCGGIEEVFRAYARRVDDLNADRLLRFVLQLEERPVTKRVGFLLELAGCRDRELIWEMERLGGRLKRFVPLDPTRPTTGKERDRRWEIALNVDPKALLKAVRT